MQPARRVEEREGAVLFVASVCLSLLTGPYLVAGVAEPPEQVGVVGAEVRRQKGHGTAIGQGRRHTKQLDTARARSVKYTGLQAGDTRRRAGG